MQSLLTVTDPASNYLLTSLANLKLELGVNDNSQDARLNLLIKQVSSAISVICDRVFAKETVSEVFRLSGSGSNFNHTWLSGSAETVRNSLVLRRRPIVGIDSVVVDELTLLTTEYEVDFGAGLLYRLTDNDVRIGWYGGKVSVGYSAGYELLDGLPSEVELACMLWIKSLRAQINRSDNSIKVEDAPDLMRREYFDPLRSVTRGSAYDPPPEVMVLLSPYIEAAIRLIVPEFMT
jgi:hypothetical protein